jgi:hypothetical protein
MVEEGASRRASVVERTLLDWLTIEKAAYAGAVLLAWLFRLVQVGASPLSPPEAAQALPALAAATGREFDLIGVSPLLFSLQRALFVLFGASDFWARWWPAFLGGLTPLLYFCLRRPLGRGGALAAAYLWAVSPMAVFGARLGLGHGLVPTLALAVVAGLALSAEREAPFRSCSGLVLAGGALGLLLASGPGAYTAVLMAVPAAVIWRKSLDRVLHPLKTCWKQVAATFLLCFALGSTFFFMVPVGLAAAADLLGTWVAGLVPGAGEYQWWEIGLRLVLSEPLLLVFGMAGLVAALRGGKRFLLFAGGFGGLALFLSLIGSGRHPTDLGLIVLALTFLAGPAIAHVLNSAWSCRKELDAWLLVVVSTSLLLSAALCLAGVFNPANTASWRQLYAAVGIVTATLSGLVWLVYGVWGNWHTVACAFPLVPLLFALAWGLGQLNGINYDRGAWQQAGVLHEEPASGWVDLQREVLDLTALDGSGRWDGRIEVALPSTQGDPLAPALRWALRAFTNVQLSSGVSPAAGPVVITLPGDQPRLSGHYSGTEITLLQEWEPSVLPDFYSRLRWVLYREARQPTEGRKIVLWMKRPEQLAQPETGAPQAPGVQTGSGMIE